MLLRNNQIYYETYVLTKLNYIRSLNIESVYLSALIIISAYLLALIMSDVSHKPPKKATFSVSLDYAENSESIFFPKLEILIFLCPAEIPIVDWYLIPHMYPFLTDILQ